MGRKTKIAIIGAGAAGCFAAANIAENNSNVEIIIFESGNPMYKLSLTGAGRCNITNNFETELPLIKIYPRGNKLLKSLFYVFNHQNTINWFENHGLKLYAQPDGRIFPTSNKAMDVVNLLFKIMNNHGVKIIKETKIIAIEKNGDYGFKLLLPNNIQQQFDNVIITTGGMGKNNFSDSLEKLGIEIITPVPSLYSFKIKSNILTSLSGQSIENVSVIIAGQKFRAEGDLLITHFGMSGPAILKLSSYAARFLADNNYKCDLIVNWLGNENDYTQIINSLIENNPTKNIISIHPTNFTHRLWEYLVNRAEIPTDKKYMHLGKKNINKLSSILTSDVYHVSGRGQYNEEFVTSGGVALNNINPKNMESKNIKNLFFAGEALDIDAITGGFNLQSAWTTGYCAAKNFF